MAIETVGIVGAGTMGGGMAINLAQHGFRVLLVRRPTGGRRRGGDGGRRLLCPCSREGADGQADANAAVGRLAIAASLADLAGADLMIEAVFEDFALKAQLLEELSPLLRPDALVATNTSCLRVGDLARHITRPERFLGLHYFSPAAVNPIVEVVMCGATATGDGRDRAGLLPGQRQAAPALPGFLRLRRKSVLLPLHQRGGACARRGLGTTGEIDAEAFRFGTRPLRVDGSTGPRRGRADHRPALAAFGVAPPSALSRVGTLGR